MTQQQPYTVLSQHKGFELRKYPAGIQIETTVGGDFVNAGSLGFRPLVQFISGNNKGNKSIAMTAPVIQESASASKHMVRFVLPEEMKSGDVPASLDPRVKVIEVPEHLAAAPTLAAGLGAGRANCDDGARSCLAAADRRRTGAARIAGSATSSRGRAHRDPALLSPQAPPS
jgi:hypothetical protein